MKKPIIKKAPRGQIVAAIKSEQRQWLEDVCEDLTGEAQRRAPKDEGTLRASAYWVIEGDKGTVIFDTPYAAVQHEQVDWVHRDGEAKYLEKPAKEKQDKYAQDLAARLRRRIGS
jgi:hypothetical protein